MTRRIDGLRGRGSRRRPDGGCVRTGTRDHRAGDVTAYGGFAAFERAAHRTLKALLGLLGEATPDLVRGLERAPAPRQARREPGSRTQPKQWNQPLALPT